MLRASLNESTGYVTITMIIYFNKIVLNVSYLPIVDYLPKLFFMQPFVWIAQVNHSTVSPVPVIACPAHFHHTFL